MSRSVSLSCPHCSAVLQVDLEAGVVVGHKPPPEYKEKIDFDDRLKQMQEEKARASDRMAEAMRKERSKDRIMGDKFRQLLDEAKGSEDDGPPLKDIDLD